MVGICLYKPKKETNFGSIMRFAYNFSIDFVCTIGNKYDRQPADVFYTEKSIPVFSFSSFYNFLLTKPENCDLISLELTDKAYWLETFTHPKNVIYIFGGESSVDRLPDEILDKSINLKIKTNRCLNLAMCAGIVLFHRHLQFSKI